MATFREKYLEKNNFFPLSKHFVKQKYSESCYFLFDSFILLEKMPFQMRKRKKVSFKIVICDIDRETMLLSF